MNRYVYSGEKIAFQKLQQDFPEHDVVWINNPDSGGEKGNAWDLELIKRRTDDDDSNMGKSGFLVFLLLIFFGSGPAFCWYVLF